MSALYVVFRVAETSFALPAREVVQMESFAGATRVPGTQPFVLGLVQVRGRVIPVVDLRSRFGLAPAPPTLDTRRLVVVQHGERLVALLADSAREVVRLEESAFGEPPELLAADGDGFIRAIARVDDRVLVGLDVGKVIGTTVPEERQDAPQG